MADTIPVVDMSGCDVQREDWDSNTCLSEARQITDAFKNIGFVYLINHGITQDQVDGVNAVTKRFFDLPCEIKKKYPRRGGPDGNQGWVASETEHLNPERPSDLKESYNITVDHKQVWPDEELPEFQIVTTEFQKQCEKLSLRILTLMAIGLGLEPSTFTKEHERFDEGITTMRCLFYPPLPPELEIKENQVRCGEHTDYGSITLLFQDDVGGLEVYTRGNQWMPAIPIPGSVLVNVADLMQRWTADVLTSTCHRVLLPSTPEARRVVRQSVAYFVHPHDATIVTPIVEDRVQSNKYPPISAKDYVNQRFAATY